MTTATGNKPTITSDAAKSAKNLAQTIAKQMAQEPWEILKQAGSQAAGLEGMEKFQTDSEMAPGRDGTAEQRQNEKLISERDKIRSQRLIAALEAELKEIRDARAQNEAAKVRREEAEKAQAQADTPKPVMESQAKKGRRFLSFGGKKSQMQKQQTQTERPLPPSG